MKLPRPADEANNCMYCQQGDKIRLRFHFFCEIFVAVFSVVPRSPTVDTYSNLCHFTIDLNSISTSISKTLTQHYQRLNTMLFHSFSYRLRRNRV